MVNEPKYYSKNGLSPNKAFEQGLLSYDEVIGFYKGNIIKYIIRLGDKEGASVSDDVRKAINYLHFLNNFIEENKMKNTIKIGEDTFECSDIELDNEYRESLDDLKKKLEDFRNEYIIK